MHINAYEAAKQINSICNLGINFNSTSKLTAREIRTNKSNQSLINQFMKWELNTFKLLCDYLHILEQWEEKYRPTKYDEEFNELYIKALQEKDKVLYYTDIFIYGTDDDKIWFYTNEKNYINQIIFTIKKGEKNNKTYLKHFSIQRINRTLAETLK